MTTKTIRIIQKLHSNSLSATYLVEYQSCNDTFKCVLKSFQFGHEQTNKQKSEIQKEANMLKEFKGHDNIVQLFHSFYQDHAFHILMEYCENGDLDIKIRSQQGKRFSERQIWEWLCQLLTSIHFVHSHQVLHRDIKPKNIFLKNNRIKLGDFGISRTLEKDQRALTSIGTPYYLAPELCDHGEYGYPVDVWGLGCTLYEIMTLTRAFGKGTTLGEVVRSILDVNYDKKAMEIHHSSLKELVNCLLLKNPNQRPTTHQLMDTVLIKAHIMMQEMKSLSVGLGTRDSIFSRMNEWRLEMESQKKQSLSADDVNYLVSLYQ